MSQVVMNELVNMSQEIIKLKDEKYELIRLLKFCHEILEDGHWQETKREIATAIEKAEATK
jgi:hypothetical protein